LSRVDRPELAKGTRVVRQVEDGRTSYVVRAGGTGKYLRVGEAEALLLNLMDGSRTLEEVRTSYVARAKENLALADLAGFVHRMRGSEVVEPTAEGRNLLLVEKARQSRRERMFMGRIGSLFFMRFKLLDPDRFLTALEPRIRFVFTKTFLVFAAFLVAAAIAVIYSRSDEVFGRLKNFFLISAGSGADFATIWVTALCIVCLHETGHGVACKHFGGEVHEMGFLLLFFNPCFYCNINDAWTFDSRASRLWVTAAGGVVEVLLGSACVLVWAATEPGSWVHGIAYLVFMISLSGTLLFNMNPLIKLDGYYLLADLLRVENLRDRSMAQVSWLFRTKVLGRPAERVTASRREAWILAVYGVSSTIYQGLILVALLTVLVAVALGGAGPGVMTMLLLGFLAWMMLKRPLRAAKEAAMQVAESQVRRHGRRGALLRAGSVAAAIVVAAVLLPWTVTSSASAVAEPWKTFEVRSPLEGTVAAILVEGGAHVEEGQPLFRIEAPEEEALAALDRETADRLRRDALRRRSQNDASGAASQEKEAEAAELRAADLEARLKHAVVGSPCAGVVLTRRVAELVRATVHRESGLLRVGDVSRLRFRTLMDARKVGPVRPGMEARVHLRAHPGTELPGKVVSVSRQPVDEKDERMKQVTGPHWEVVVETDAPGVRVLPGMNGDVDVVLGHTSVAGAFLRGVRGTVRGDLLR
jgi:multidrug efflux pump subunit AcrA (membrane-fusion protein)